VFHGEESVGTSLIAKLDGSRHLGASPSVRVSRADDHSPVSHDFPPGQNKA